MARTRFFKGHGTGNDFVIVDDQHGMSNPDAQEVALLCDRRFGIGGDGLLRVVRARHVKEWDGEPDIWFMDYRNADGSIAEMCGNGLRVFARFLLNENLVPGGDFSVATRAGLRRIEVGWGGNLTTAMGEVRVSDEPLTVRLGDKQWSATEVNVGNPHAVVSVTAEELEELDLHHSPSWEPRERFPDGANIEFVVTEGPGQLRLRVYERGTGETLSCGTGVVAAAAVHQRQQQPELDCPILVGVPGGELSVEMKDGDAWLTGPAEVTMRGEFWN